MPDVDLVAEDVGKDDLGQVLFLLVAVEIALCDEHALARSATGESAPRLRSAVGQTLELLSDVSHLAVDALLLELPHTTCAQVRDVLSDGASMAAVEVQNGRKEGG